MCTCLSSFQYYSPSFQEESKCFLSFSSNVKSYSCMAEHVITHSNSFLRISKKKNYIQKIYYHYTLKIGMNLKIWQINEWTCDNCMRMVNFYWMLLYEVTFILLFFLRLFVLKQLMLTKKLATSCIFVW